MRIALRAALLALLVSFAFVSVHAAILVTPIAGAIPDLFGACVGCTQLGYVSTTHTAGSLTYTLNAAVFTDPSNTFCAGCMDFVYQVTNRGDLGSTDVVGRVTGSIFTGYMVDAGYSTAGEPAGGGTAFPVGTIAPGLVDRNTDDVVGFQFSSSPSTSIPPGSTSTVLVIETNAKTFGGGVAGVLDAVGSSVPAFSPVPEPTTALLLGLGLLGLAGVRRFRRS